ncbi:LacI family DNA-binding transcriptional regulator [Microlunatus soli]|uniref:Transcriptional regulator, LacI family n=1 Tax=Microlunatus soli TaxID=630515 RepID=A0A1H1X9I9_9ACTN|nr:LacI family DNA-binding transcriptional regulator [Microlunatus soli]SDT05882.1 transcriptional regulator, LacI family [Microlunatus soli]
MIRIVDVAREAQVSVATVSRTLNNSARVDPVLAERVRAAVQKLGYRPNAVARNLRRRGTQVWALIITNLNNPFYTAVARGVEDVASELGYSVLLCNTDEDQAKQDRYLEVAAMERVAGVILAPRSDDSDVSTVQDDQIPLVVVDRALRQPVDFVTAASFEGAVLATEHLLRQGWRRPACITRPADTATAEQRRLGYEDVMRRHGLAPVVRHVGFHAGGSAEMISALLAERDAPDAFLTIDSMLALDVLGGLQRAGLHSGRDVGVISFDDASWAPVVDPPLSVIAQPAYEMGAEAARLLARRVRSEGPAEPQTMIMSTTLIVRGSCRRPKR